MFKGGGSDSGRQQSNIQAEAQFATLYRRYAGPVMAYALRRCSPEDAADVVSETFVVAWRRFDEVPDEPAIKPWLLGVARRVLANQRRGIRRRGELVKKLSTYMSPRLQEISLPAGRDEALIVVEALKQLSKRDREVLLLAAWEELTPSEIAVMFGVSSSVIRKRLFRARKRLVAAAAQLDPEMTGFGHKHGDGQDKAILALRKQATAW